MTTAELTHLRRVYGEVCKGFSTCLWEEKQVFVRHLDSFSQTDVDSHYEAVLRDVSSKGIMTEVDRLKYLDGKGLWTTGHESEIANHRVYTANLEKTRSLLVSKIQREPIEAQLREAQIKMNEMASKRVKLIGLTAEKVAEQKTQHEYLRLSFFKDAQFEKPLFSVKDMRQLGESDSDEILSLYIDIIQRFSLDNLRRIAVQPFFTNYYYLCGDDPSLFFGLPIVKMTIQQVNLLSYGHYFKSIFQHHEIPKEFAQDPDKVEEFVTKSSAAKKMMAEVPQTGHRVGLVGWQQEDFQAAGVQDGTQTMRDAAAKQYQTGRDAAKDLGVNWTDPR